jgi:cytoplasmic iron level regulating protein YaaA (DUF328/UPF0246 family)
MIVILSSSKTQMVTPVPCAPSSKPPLLNQAKPLIERCRELSHTELTTLMKISDKLAQTTYERFQQFSSPQVPGSAGAALASFRGDVFSEIKTESYSAEDFVFAHHTSVFYRASTGFFDHLISCSPTGLRWVTDWQFIAPDHFMSSGVR